MQVVRIALLVDEDEERVTLSMELAKMVETTDAEVAIQGCCAPDAKVHCPQTRVA